MVWPRVKHYSDTHDNHPAITPFIGPFWHRPDPFHAWPRGSRIDPLNVLMIGFLPVFLWPTWWVATIWTLGAGVYVRWIEPRISVVAKPWEIEDIRDVDLGSFAAWGIAALTGLAP